MTLALFVGSAAAVLIACILVRKRWVGGKEIDARSDVTKLVISADKRRQQRQKMQRVVRDGRPL